MEQMVSMTTATRNIKITRSVMSSNEASLTYSFQKYINSRFIRHDTADPRGPRKSNHMWLIKGKWLAEKKKT